MIQILKRQTTIVGLAGLASHSGAYQLIIVENMLL